jgi:hypothetical protein
MSNDVSSWDEKTEDENTNLTVRVLDGRYVVGWKGSLDESQNFQVDEKKEKKTMIKSTNSNQFSNGAKINNSKGSRFCPFSH